MMPYIADVTDCHVSSLNLGRLQGHLRFLKGGDVRVRTGLSESTATSRHSPQIALQRKCWHEIRCGRRSQLFDVDFRDTDALPTVEVVIQSSLVKMIPLLDEIASSTLADYEGPSFTDGVVEGFDASLELPCSVWGVVSLLLLVEGTVFVSMDGWLTGADGHPGLAMETLEAADFLKRDRERTHILCWLQGAMQEVASFCRTATSEAQQASALQHRCPRIWYLTQVLQHVTHRFSSDVYSMRALPGISPEQVALPHDSSEPLPIELASHLPQKLLANALSVHAPTLQLISSTLSHSQLMRIASCLQNLSPCPNIHSLHLCVPNDEAEVHSDDLMGDFEELLRAASDLRSPQHSICCSPACNSNCISSTATHVTVGFACPHLKCSHRNFSATQGAPKFSIAAMRQSQTTHDALALLQEYCKPCNASYSQCCVHRHRHRRAPRLASLGFLCPVCGELCASIGAPMLELPDACLPRPTFDLLSMFGGVLSGMCSLKSFVLHMPCLKEYALPVLGQLFHSLPPTVSSLTLTTGVPSESVPGRSCGVNLSVSGVKLLFMAIAKARSVKELYLPQWDVLVGRHGDVCVEALQGVSGLECVHVRGLVKLGMNRDWGMFPRGIAFRDIDSPEGGEACDTAVPCQ